MSTVWGSYGDCQRRHIYKIALNMAHMGEEVDVTLYLRWFLVVTICKLRPSLYLLHTVSYNPNPLHKKFKKIHKGPRIHACPE